MSWQRNSGYNRRSLVETTMFRYKTVIGRRLHARTLPNQAPWKLLEPDPEAKARAVASRCIVGHYLHYGQ
jgi:hypothetical protein